MLSRVAKIQYIKMQLRKIHLCHAQLSEKKPKKQNKNKTKTENHDMNETS